MAFNPINTQEEFDQAIAARIARLKSQHEAEVEDLRNRVTDYDELREKLTAAENSNNELNEQLKTANGKVASYAREAEKIKIAEAYGLNSGFASYLKGETEEEMKASAEFLKENLNVNGGMPKAKPQPTAGTNPYKKLISDMKGE